MSKKQRLDKLLSNLGLGTRKEVRKIIKDGRVIIDDTIQTDVGAHVNGEESRIIVDGNVLEYKEYIYVMLNKPQGVISATYDPFDKTVIDLLPREIQAFNPFPVGRLDKDTEGLLLITNDGKLGHRLLSPKKHVPKTYYALIKGVVGAEDISMFNQGVVLEDGYKTLPSILNVIESGETSKVEVTIYEGKFHQIKRMFISLNKEVIYLKRLSMGSLNLDPKLNLGEFRELTEEELEKLKGEDITS